VRKVAEFVVDRTNVSDGKGWLARGWAGVARPLCEAEVFVRQNVSNNGVDATEWPNWKGRNGMNETSWLGEGGR
jgi:hypothetical protein